MAPSIPKTIAFVTTNKDKIREITTILSAMNMDMNIPIETRALDLPEIQGTTEEIALDKCRRAAVAVWHMNQSFLKTYTA
jgi:inosine triphosphate pyrophosphatase